MTPDTEAIDRVLGPLGPGEHRELVGGLLPLVTEVREEVVRLTAGHPRSTVELLADLVRQHRSSAGPHGQTLRPVPRRHFPPRSLRRTSGGTRIVIGPPWRRICEDRGVDAERLRARLLSLRLVDPRADGFAWADPIVSRAVSAWTR